MRSKKTTSAVAILALFDILKDHGVSVSQIGEKTGIDRSKMEDPDVRISMDQFLHLWQIAEDVTQDPAIGLHLRKSHGEKYMHFAVIVAFNSDTLSEAAKAWADYAMLVCDTDRVEIIEKNNHFVINYACSTPEYENKWIPEHHFSYMLEYARKIIGKQINPLEVWFRHSDPGYHHEYEKLFCCPVFFGKADNLMILNQRDSRRPISSADPYLKALVKKHADNMVKKYSQKESLKEKIRVYISKRLHQGTISVQSVSDAMNMNRSTLHRHLKKENTTFLELFTETRKHLAKKYLIQGLTASQTGYLVGFSDPSSFFAAFKRWYGQSPGDFRKKFGKL